MSKNNCVGNCIKKGESVIHPFNLNIWFNEIFDEACPITGKYDKESKSIDEIKSNCDGRVKSEEQLINFMNKPYVNVNDNYLINDVFNVNKIDDLERWVNSNLDKPIRYINRILNLWIKLNFNDIKNEIKKLGDRSLDENFLLVKIYLKLLKSKNLKYEKANMTKILPKFIKAWFKEKINLNKTEIDDFSFNLLEDLQKYLSKKYRNE